MYESPINLIEKQVAFDIEKTIEGEVWKVTKEIGIDVNKEELIKALQYDRDQYEKGYYDGLNAHKWIPVSERLPENDDDVLVCFAQGDMAVAFYHIDTTHYPTQFEDMNETGWFDEEDDALYSEPIAWMPLPKPYKAESEE